MIKIWTTSLQLMIPSINKFDQEYWSNKVQNEAIEFEQKNNTVKFNKSSKKININLNQRFNDNWSRRGNVLWRSSDFIDHIPSSIKYGRLILTFINYLINNFVKNKLLYFIILKCQIVQFLNESNNENV